jgi:hypothetical protein
LAVLVIAGLGLALTACGGDDDDAEAPAAEADEGGENEGDENADAEGGADEDGEDAGTGDEGDDAEADADEDRDDGETIEVDDIDDIPDECRDLLEDMLKQIEPLVEDIDWENADLSEMESFGEELEAEMSGMEEEFDESGCDDYELGDDTSMEPLIDLARDEAPGTVAYLEWIQGIQEDFADITIPDISIPDISIPDISIPDISLPADAPQDCDSAIAAFEDLMAEYDTLMDMSIEEMGTYATVSGAITTTCSFDDISVFYERDDVNAFLGSG